MDNAFYEFITKYRADIIAFFHAIVNFFKAIFAEEEAE